MFGDDRGLHFMCDDFGRRTFYFVGRRIPMKKSILVTFEQPMLEILYLDTQDFITLSVDQDENKGYWDIKETIYLI